MTEKELKYIFNFINKHYPVKRIKIQKKFKRAVVLDNGSSCLLSNKFDKPKLLKELSKELITIFGYNEITTLSIISHHFNI
jgi:hypothetical protein